MPSALQRSQIPGATAALLANQKKSVNPCNNNKEEKYI